MSSRSLTGEGSREAEVLSIPGFLGRLKRCAFGCGDRTGGPRRRGRDRRDAQGRDPTGGEPESTIVTDENPSYGGIGMSFDGGHRAVNHRAGEYARIRSAEGKRLVYRLQADDAA
jgi:hypothetical protein